VTSPKKSRLRNYVLRRHEQGRIWLQTISRIRETNRRRAMPFGNQVDLYQAPSSYLTTSFASSPAATVIRVVTPRKLMTRGFETLCGSNPCSFGLGFHPLERAGPFRPKAPDPLVDVAANLALLESEVRASMVAPARTLHHLSLEELGVVQVGPTGRLQCGIWTVIFLRPRWMIRIGLLLLNRA
jgi:hypothetical protein